MSSGTLTVDTNTQTTNDDCCNKTNKNTKPGYGVIEKTPSSSSDDESSSYTQIFCWFLIGTGFLFPYNSVVTAVDFFNVIYFHSIDFYLGWLLLAPSMIILIITLKYGYIGSIYFRIIFCFLIEGILTLIIPLVRNVYIVFISTFILGILSAILQGTLFSLLGFLGSKWMSIAQTGIGFSGVLVGLIRIFTKYFIPNDIRNSTYLYFLLAFIMVCGDILIYIFIVNPSKNVQKAVKDDEIMKHKLQNTNKKTGIMKHHSTDTLKLNTKPINYNTMEINVESPKNPNNPKNSENVQHIDDMHAFSLFKLFTHSWRCQIAVFINYVVTLSLFPGVISLMQWSADDDQWFAVIQIFFFNFFDTIGKNICTYPAILNAWSHNGLLIAALCRLCFIPLFVMCVKPLIFRWQIAIIINAFMGITNGLVGTSGFCLGPLSKGIPEHEKGRVSQMIAVSLTSGLVVGSSSAFAINYVMDYYL